MSCCKTLGNIEKRCGGGASPGLAPKMYIACAEHVFEIPVKDDFENGVGEAHTISTDIVMTTDDPATTEDETGVFYCWNFDQKSSSYTAEPQGDDGENGWIATLNFFVSKLNPLSSYIFNNTAGGDFVVIYDDKCGNRRILGDLICGGATIKVGEQTNDKCGYNVTITWPTSYLPCWYTGAIPV